MRIILETLKAGLQFTYGIVFLVLILWMLPDIMVASKKLLERAAAATSLELMGVKIAFTPATVRHGFKLVGLEVPSDKQSVLDAIHGLDTTLFIRLMTIGGTTTSCDYEFAEPQMRRDVVLDYELAGKKLASIERTPQILESVRAKNQKSVSEGAIWTIGEPHACYTLTLTPLGSEVKTAIVTSLAPAFNNVVPSTAPDEERKVTAMN